MGHGDELVLADINFPAVSVAATTVDGVIRADGIGIPALLKAILQLMPLDFAVEAPCGAMRRVTVRLLRSDVTRAAVCAQPSWL
jgi:L-fucose mutarotase